VIGTFASCIGCLGQPIQVGDVSSELQGVQQGVDRAGVFSPSEAKAIKSAYGTTFTGVYIGGPCNGGSGWTAATVTDIYNATQWGFLPTYVGQQSAAICGAATLTHAQGVADGQSALNIMKAFMWVPGYHIPIALDLEAGAFAADNAGALAYTAGFAETVGSHYDVYVYSSGLALNAMATANTPIAGAWTAHWLHTNGGYMGGLSPSQVPGLSSTWTSRPGAWQYNSGPSVAGGVDYDVADFTLAPPPGQIPQIQPDLGPSGSTDMAGGNGADMAGGLGADMGSAPANDLAAKRDGSTGTGGHYGCAIGGPSTPASWTQALSAALLLLLLVSRRRRCA
jgi:hypothetical protein